MWHILYYFYPKKPLNNQIPVLYIVEDYYDPIFPLNPIGSEIALNILPFVAHSPKNN